MSTTTSYDFITNKLSAEVPEATAAVPFLTMKSFGERGPLILTGRADTAVQAARATVVN